ncbi:MAG TPA: hypothetical protein VIM79_11295 [Niastella sp.]
MKRILPYLLLAGLPAMAQQNTRLKINLTADPGRLNSIYKLKPDSIRFYKLPAGKLAFTIPPETIQQSFELSQVPVGKYRVTYRNLFMEKSTSNITLRKIPLNEISLCLDSLDSFPLNTLATLQDKDSIQLHYNAFGCGTGTTGDIVITKENDHFVARMLWSYEDLTAIIRSELEGKPPPKEHAPTFRSTILTDQQIKAFIKFENELFKIRPFGDTIVYNNKTIYTIEYICTTEASYTLKSKYLNIEKEDKGCMWDGFEQLSVCFFGKRYY